MISLGILGVLKRSQIRRRSTADGGAQGDGEYDPTANAITKELLFTFSIHGSSDIPLAGRNHPGIFLFSSDLGH
jgi:hypothetical protein